MPDKIEGDLRDIFNIFNAAPKSDLLELFFVEVIINVYIFYKKYCDWKWEIFFVKFTQILNQDFS